MGLLATLTFIGRHPLARRQRARAYSRWLRWQVCKALLPGALAVPFVNDTRLLMSPGMAGATGNYYCGLHEFEDMAFVLHMLRPGDLFIDVGANVGAYTVLAIATGADVQSYEPDPAAFMRLSDNVNLNRAAQRATLRNVAAGAASADITMTSDLDTMNHVLPVDAHHGGRTLSVPAVRLDDDLPRDTRCRVLKIDVEGYESQVLAGAPALLASPLLQAVIVELNGSGRRFGQSDQSLDKTLRDNGLRPCRYLPFERRLVDGPRGAGAAGSDNMLYLRDPATIQARLTGAPGYRVAGVTL